MNPELLLAHFDRISDAPDAVPRLRRFVLDLAVRGKLVEQDRDDETASDLIQRIRLKKAEMTNNGAARKEKPLPSFAEDELPFRIPNNWCWSQLAEIGFINPRNTAEDRILSSFIPMALISTEYGVASTHDVKPWGEIKSGFTHFAEGDVALAKITPCFENGKSAVFRGLTGGIGSGTTELHVVRPVFVCSEYVLIFLKCPHFIESGIYRMTGTAGQKRVPTQYFAYSPFPLPPLPEQSRIVAKVDELMALCDRLDTAQRERDAQRDRLTSATHHHLNNGANAAAFHELANFCLSNLTRLTTHPDQIKQVRHTILNLAVRGKIVPQNPNEESVSRLLDGIQAEKEELIQRRALKREAGESSLSEDEFPFDLPASWRWINLHSVIVFGPQNGISPKPSLRSDAPKAITLTATTKGIFDSHYFKQVEAKVPHDSEFWLRPGDLLFQRGNTREYVGIAAYYTGEPGMFLYPDLMMKVRLSDKVNLRYIHLCAVAPHARAYFSTHASGAQATMPKINQGILLKLPIPLPPHSEQLRIVTKVDELMTICDRLEAQLTSVHAEAGLLLESVLFNALNDSQPAHTSLDNRVSSHSLLFSEMRNTKVV